MYHVNLIGVAKWPGGVGGSVFSVVVDSAGNVSHSHSQRVKDPIAPWDRLFLSDDTPLTEVLEHTYRPPN